VKIVACPFKDPIKFTINEPKKKNFKTSMGQKAN
jgi:hypothetical protein